MITEKQVTEWAKDYIQFQLSIKTEENNLEKIDFTPSLRLNNLLSEDHESCWLVILEIVNLTNSRKVLDVLSAGLIEDLIEDYGELFIDRIESIVKENPKFKLMLENIWHSGSSEVWERILQIRKTPDLHQPLYSK